MKPVLTSCKKIFFITAIVFAFSGCSSETIYILTEEELLWMAYDNNQVITYQNDSGAIRTYKVSGRWRGEGNAGVIIGLVGDTIPNNGGKLLLLKDGSGFTVTVNWPHYPVKFTPTSMVAITETVNGTPFTDVYVSAAASPDSIRNVREVHYSKSTGVIKFKEKTGVIWSLKN